MQDDYISIPLTEGKHTTIDAGDLDLVSGLTWRASRSDERHYAKAKVPLGGSKYREVYMHRLIMGAGKGEYVDHINGDPLDNRRANLRICSNAQNGRNRSGTPAHNTSGYIGVSWHKAAQKWQAKIMVNRKGIHLGLYESAEEAATVRDKAAVEFHGAFAKLNLPSDKVD